MKIFIFLALIHKIRRMATPHGTRLEQGQDNLSVQQNFQTCSVSIHKCTHIRSFQKTTLIFKTGPQIVHYWFYVHLL